MRVAAALLLALTVATPEIKYFRYQRPIPMPEQKSGQACMALEGAVFAHSAPGLPDLRLYRDRSEVPYLLHQAAPPDERPETVLPLNAGVRGNQADFDVEMPGGRYSNVELALAGEDFVAAVTVTGSQTEGGAETLIGTYTVFDLTRQKLGRGMMLALPESDYRYLHFRIKGPVKAENIRGIRVARVVEQKLRYVQVALTGPGVVRDRATVLTVAVPAHVPVDRIVFTPSAQPSVFNRTVRVTYAPLNETSEHPAREEFLAEGSLLRMHGVQHGHRIDQERLAVEIPIGGRDETATWTITIDNGDDAPLRIESARLEMVERDLCFDANASGSMTLYYGDGALAPPHYDYGVLTVAQTNAIAVVAGAETANPDYQPRPDERPFTEKHPWLLWAALCVVIVVLGGVTLRTIKKSA
jgi:hypothetical protein